MEQNTERDFYTALQAYDKAYAVVMYDRVIEKEPSTFIAWNNRGNCKADLGFEMGDKAYVLEGLNDAKEAIAIAEKQGVDYLGAKWNVDRIEKKLASM